MGDLADLIRRSSDRDTDALIQARLAGSTAEWDDLESRQLQQDLAAQSLQRVQQKEDPVFIISLPETTRARREVERVLAPLGASRAGRHVTINSNAFLRFVDQR